MPDFFDQVDAIGVVERHLKKVLGLEEAQGEKLIEAYQEARRELLDRLMTVRSDSFTAQQMRGVLLQIQSAIEAISRGMKAQMLQGGELAAQTGVEDLLAETQRFEEEFTGAVVPINVNAAALAADANNLLISKYDSSITAYSEALRAQISGNLAQAVIQEMPYDMVVQRIGQFFLGEQWKIHRLARTELHNVYATGKLMTMRELVRDQVPDLKKTLYHPMDSRTAADSKYAARLELIVPIDEPFRYKWRGEERVYMAPPDRPNDRSILIPYRSAWE